jgi:hypothetical protein
MPFDPKAISQAIQKANTPKADPLNAIKEITTDDNEDATPISNATDIDMLGAAILMLRDIIAEVDAKVMKLADFVQGGSVEGREAVVPTANDLATAEASPEKE